MALLYPGQLVFNEEVQSLCSLKLLVHQMGIRFSIHRHDGMTHLNLLGRIEVVPQLNCFRVLDLQDKKILHGWPWFSDNQTKWSITL